ARAWDRVPPSRRRVGHAGGDWRQYQRADHHDCRKSRGFDKRPEPAAGRVFGRRIVAPFQPASARFAPILLTNMALSHGSYSQISFASRSIPIAPQRRKSTVFGNSLVAGTQHTVLQHGFDLDQRPGEPALRFVATGAFDCRNRTEIGDFEERRGGQGPPPDADAA